MGNNFGFTRKKIAGLIFLLVFSLVFIFSCTCFVLPFGNILVGTFGYMVFPLSVFLGLISLALFLGFSYSRRIKSTTYIVIAVLSVLLAVHSIATYKPLNAIVDAETLKAYLASSYESFSLLGSFGSILGGIISLALGGMGTIVVYVILATIFIGLFVDFQFYGKFTQPHIKKLKTHKLREKVYSSDTQRVGENRPNYSFENNENFSNDDVLDELTVNANDYEDGSNRPQPLSYDESDVVGEVTNEYIDNSDNNSYVSYGNENVTSFYTGLPSEDYGYQTQNYFSDNNIAETNVSDIPDVYDYNAYEQRRRFMNATFGVHENEQAANFEPQNINEVTETNQFVSNPFNENLGEPSNNYVSSYGLNESQNNFNSEDNNSVNEFSNQSSSFDMGTENSAIDDEISRILNSSEEDLNDEVKLDYSSNSEFLNINNSSAFDMGGKEQSPNDFGMNISNNNTSSNSLWGSTNNNLKIEEENNAGGFSQTPNYSNSSVSSNNLSNSFEQNRPVNPSPISSQNMGTNSFSNNQNIGAVNQNNMQNMGIQGQEKPVIPQKEQKKPYSFNLGLPGVRYNPPPLNLLRAPQPDNGDYTEEQERKSTQLENVLAAFNIPAKVKNIVRGPKITRYELSVPLGVSVKKIPMFENDIAAALAAKTIVIKAPIPGSSYVGIELENDTFSSVYERELLESDEFQNFKDPLPIAIGKDISGEIVVKSLAKMVHLLIAGSTGSGKSVFIHNIVMSLIYKSSPDDLRLIMIDPKKVEFNRYNGLPHLLTPEVVMGADKAINALKWSVKEMQRRYDLLSRAGYNNIEPYNKSELVKAGQFEKMPYIVIIVDELAEIMMVNKKEVEACIQSLTQLARACGMHMILATQRPSVDIISGVIKNNVPSRIAFSLQSGIDSKTILNSVGAEKLLGQGDMIFAPTGTSATPRLQAAYASDEEIKAVIDYDIKYNNANYDEAVNNIINQEAQSAADEVGGSGGDGMPPKGGVDEYFKTALKLVMQNGGASVSYLQRRLSIGYSRAARIVDQMEDKGYIAGATGAKVRKVLITPDQFRQEFGEEYNDIND